MSSSVYFRMKHGTVSEPINFDGHQIRLLELKRAIIEKKQLRSGLDFDLQISDAENSSRG